MIEKKEIANEKTILIGTIKPGETDELIQEHLSELELLAETAGAEVIGKITPVSYTHLTLPTKA